MVVLDPIVKVAGGVCNERIRFFYEKFFDQITNISRYLATNWSKMVKRYGANIFVRSFF